ncbi:MAG: hypothetical protein IPP17_01875 [Bacteroidetes bacterium]|nr:hypothetical protein [Bacteroidota bacterium]
MGRQRHRDCYIYFPNFYSDTAFYFVTWGGANGRRITAFPSAANPNFTPTYTTKFGHYEVDKDNTITSGRLWMGERFDLTTTQSFNFNLPNIVSGSMGSPPYVQVHGPQEGNSPFAKAALPMLN